MSRKKKTKMMSRDEVKSFWIKAVGRCREIAYRGNTIGYRGWGRVRKVIENAAGKGKAQGA